MSPLIEFEKQILALPAVEREQLATLTWESLFRDPKAAGNYDIDPEGVEIAAQRNIEIRSGAIKPINHDEFVQQTSGDLR